MSLLFLIVMQVSVMSRVDSLCNFPSYGDISAALCIVTKSTFLAPTRLASLNQKCLSRLHATRLCIQGTRGAPLDGDALLSYGAHVNAHTLALFLQARLIWSVAAAKLTAAAVFVRMLGRPTYRCHIVVKLTM